MKSLNPKSIKVSKSKENLSKLRNQEIVEEIEKTIIQRR